MPRKSQRECARVGCRNLVDSGYCPEHVRVAEKAYDSWRGSAVERGYDAAWTRFRRWFLSRPEHAVCEDCGRAQSLDVHHKKKLRDFPELRLSESNCKGLCRRCHSEYTRRGE